MIISSRRRRHQSRGQLVAQAAEEGTGPVDADLSLVNDAGKAFQGEPASAVARQTGSLHVGSDHAHYAATFAIHIDAAALQSPLAYPLLGQISVGVTAETSAGHPFAHDTSFAFESAALDADDYAYRYVAINGNWQGEPPEPPAVLDLRPVCRSGRDCDITRRSIRATTPI